MIEHQTRTHKLLTAWREQLPPQPDRNPGWKPCKRVPGHPSVELASAASMKDAGWSMSQERNEIGRLV